MLLWLQISGVRAKLKLLEERRYRGEGKLIRGPDTRIQTVRFRIRVKNRVYIDELVKQRKSLNHSSYLGHTLQTCALVVFGIEVGFG